MVLRYVVYDTDEQVLVGDTRVRAEYVVAVDGPRFVVSLYGWSSEQPGAGNTNRALQQLRRQWPGALVVHDCGLAGDASYRYWQHQLSRGRVDQAFDDDFRPLSGGAGENCADYANPIPRRDLPDNDESEDDDG